ncbi:FmdB family zinc ribbon protein [Candidatus Hydrogenedentota bacterium]
MPTYEYQCPKCGEAKDIFHSMSLTLKPSQRRCPVCSAAMKKQIGAGAGIIFKGSGFHCTDYRSDSYNNDKAAAKSNSTCDACKSNKDNKKVECEKGKGTVVA